MKNPKVVIAGGGPTGLVLAAELTLSGVDVAVVERRENQELVGSRGGGLHARTLEVFDMRGIVERFLAQGKTAQVVRFQNTTLDLGGFPTRHPYGLALFQNHIERILAGWVDELGITILRNRTVTGFAQDDSGVDVAVSDGSTLRAEYLVGCEGGRSLVRKTAGIDFPGWDPTTSWMIAEVEMSAEPALGMREDAAGIHAMHRMENGHTVRLVLTERELQSGSEPTLDDLRAALTAVYGTDFGAHSPTWLSRFTDMTRQAAAYRNKRVLLAGDAAHVHPPLGGQGLNIGVQDAVNLGWKLAQVVRGNSADGLLDSYHRERHPVAARVLRNTMAQMALRRTDERSRALGEIVSELLESGEARKRLAGEMSGLAVHYDLGKEHPLLGRRMPDLDLETAEGPVRFFSLLREPRFVLLDLGMPGGVDLAPWESRIQRVRARYDGPWELPVVGRVDPPRGVLIRPDGHVAWVDDGTWAGLQEALARW